MLSYFYTGGSFIPKGSSRNTGDRGIKRGGRGAIIFLKA